MNFEVGKWVFWDDGGMIFVRKKYLTKKFDKYLKR